MNKKTKAIIKSILSDMKSDNQLLVTEAATTLDNRVVADLLLLAGCPQNIIHAMQETAPLSLVERRYCVDQILTKLKEQ